MVFAVEASGLSRSSGSLALFPKALRLHLGTGIYNMIYVGVERVPIYRYFEAG